MPGRRSISVEPENIAVASPRRSSRIKINHQDSPLPVGKTTGQELPARRTRRSSSIQEKSLNDMKEDVKKIVDEKPKTPARRTRRSISAQDEQKPILKDVTIKLLKTETKENAEDKEVQKAEEGTPPPAQAEDGENTGGRPKRRVTRSMSKSPVSLKNAKPSAPPPATRSRRLSLNDKQSNDAKVPTLDIITENEGEHEKNEETNKNDVLNNNKKQTQIAEKTEQVVEEISEKTNESDTTEPQNESVKEVLNTSVKSAVVPSPRRSPRVKAKESNTTPEEEEEEETKMNVSQEKIEEMEKKLNELIGQSKEKVKQDIEETKEVEEPLEKVENKEVEEPLEKVENKEVEEPLEKVENKEVDETLEKVEHKEIEKTQEKDIVDDDDADKLNESNISIVEITNLNSSTLKDKEEISKEDDERPQNISLVNDDGRSYSPIIPKTNISLKLNDSRKSLNSTCTPKKLDISLKNTSQTMESLQISIKDEDDETAKDISVNLDESCIKSTPAKTANDSVASIKSLESGKKSNKSTPIKTTDNKENDDMNTSTTSNSSKKKSSSKRGSINQLREQILDDYIASFTAEKKRKRESMNTSELEDSSENSKKRRSGQMSKVSNCNFSEDEESDGETKNEFIDDTVSVGSEDTPSTGSNEIVELGEYIGSSNSEQDSDDTYENDSFVVDDDEVEDEELLSGTEDFLGNLGKPKRKRILRMVSDSEEEKDKLENMSMEPFGGASPTNMSEKQISSVDSDLESIKTRNEELSKQIEDGTLIPEVEPKRKDEESDDDIMIVEEENPKEEEKLETQEIIENVQEEKETIEDIQEKTNDNIEEDEDKETIDDIEKEIVEDVQEEIQEKTNENIEKEIVENVDETNEDIEKEIVKDIEKEIVEDIEKEIVEDIENKIIEDIQKETVEDIQEQIEVEPDEEIQEEVEPDDEIQEEVEPDEEIQEEVEPVKEVQIEEDKETKYKKLLEKYFNVTNKNRTRRQTIGETINKTPTKPSSRKRRTSLGIEIRDFKNEHEELKTQIIEVNTKQFKDETDTKYEFNNSGVYKVSPAKMTQNEEGETLLMLQDFNDSLNDSLDLIKSSQIDIPITSSPKHTNEENVETSSGKKKRRHSKTKNKSDETPEKLEETPEKSSPKHTNEENVETSSGKKKRRHSKTKNKSEETPEKLEVTPEKSEETPEKSSEATETTESGGKKKRKQNKTETIETTEEQKKRKINAEENINKTDDVSPNKKLKKKKLNKKQSVSSESDTNTTVLNSSFQSSTDSEKENSMQKTETNKRKKSKSPTQCTFNFKVQNGKLSPSKSEIEYENYVPPRHRNIYKNLIKPSSSGFSGSNQFIIKDLVSKVSHGIKKQKYTHGKINKNNITGMTNCANWKETLFTEAIVKPVQISSKSTSRKYKK